MILNKWGKTGTTELEIRSSHYLNIIGMELTEQNELYIIASLPYDDNDQEQPDVSILINQIDTRVIKSILTQRVKTVNLLED